MAAALPAERDAWLYREFGTQDAVLRRGSVAVPPLGPKDVAVRVKAAALNPVDTYIMQGLFAAASQKFPVVPGKDLAGEVLAVGSEVSRFAPGDSVYGTTFAGSLASITLSEEGRLAPLPQGWSWEEAASLPIALLTALEAFDRAGLKEGQSVFITAGAGGVGAYAIQLARALGASRIVVTASAGKHALVKELGATEAVDYTAVDFAKAYAGANFDVALDSTRESSKLLEIIAPGTGKVISITDFSAPPPVIAFGLDSKGVNLERLRPLLESRKIKPVLDPSSPYKFDDAVGAFQKLSTKRATGKIVVTVEGAST